MWRIVGSNISTIELINLEGRVVINLHICTIPQGHVGVYLLPFNACSSVNNTSLGPARLSPGRRLR